MARIRIVRLLVALLLAAVAAPTGGAAVRSAAHADSPTPVVVPAPSVPPDLSDSGAAIVATTDDDEDDAPQTIPAGELLASDGTLHLDGTFTGAVDLSGWHVTLDPERGPVFQPQSLASTWENLGTGGPGAVNNPVHAIAISGTDVYVGGNFTDAGGVSGARYVARWDGTQWHSLGSGVNGPVYAIAVSGSDVYVGGEFTNAGGVSGTNRIARWNGATWSGLLSGAIGIDGPAFFAVHAIAVSGTNVYVGGEFTNAGGVSGTSHIARWDGVRWHALGGGLNGSVYALAVSGSNVYVGGTFTDAGGNPDADYIARWDGSQWHPLGGGINNTVFEIAVTGTDMYVGGNFSNAGGNPYADFIAVTRARPSAPQVYLPLIVR